MTAWNPKANDIFARAIEFADASERAAFVDRECGNDHTLRARVRKMMASNTDAGSFLQSPPHALKFASDDFREFEVPSHFAPEAGVGDAALEKTFSPSAGDTDINDLFADDDGEPIQTFGDYELLEEIARGGMGVVYKARQTKLNRIVAIKMILTGQLASHQEIQRFQAEAEAAAGLEHAGIVPVYEVGELDDRHFFSMGYVEGGPLSSRLRDGPVPAREAATLTKQIAEAVAYAHSKGVIHRDLKPANVLMDGEGRPKITDFGLAKQVEVDSGLTATGQILGTPGFMSPEQARGANADTGPATDVYAVGAILYNLLTGRAPFQGASPVETLKQVLSREPVSPRLLNPTIDRDLETICLKCLEKDAGRRYVSAQNLADELGRYLSGEPIHARPISTTARSWRWCRRNPMVAGLTGAAVLFLIVGTVVSTIFAFQANQNAAQANDNFATSEIQRQRADRNAATAGERENEARALLRQVQMQSQESRRKLYNAQMNVCGLAAESDGAVSLIQQHLSNWLPKDGQTDLRGWEWQFFDAHIHRAARTMNLRTQGFALDWSPDGEHLAIGGYLSITILNRQGQRVAELQGHEHYVRAVQWDPSGQRLASGCVAGMLLLWEDPLRSEKHRQLPCADDTILSLDWSHDGAVLAAVFETDERVELWQPDTDNPPTVIAGTGRQAQFSPFDRRLACAYYDDLRIWQVDDPQTPEIIATFSKNGARLKGLAWSPSGDSVAAGLINGEIKLFDLPSETIETLRGHTESVNHVAWSSDETRFISGGFDYTVRVWDTEFLGEVETLRGHTDRVFSAEYHPDDMLIISTGEDSTVRFWTPDSADIRDVTGETYGLTPGHGHQWRVAWNPTTATVATSGNKYSTIRDSSSLKQGRTFPGPHVCWNHDGTLAAYSERDSVTIWDARTGEVAAQVTMPGESDKSIHISTLAWDPQINRIAVVCGIYSPGPVHGAVFVWPVEQPEPERVLDLEITPLCAAYSPDGTKLAVGCNYGKISIRDEVSGDVTDLKLAVHREAVYSVCWSPDGSRLAMGCADHSIQIRDMRTEAITALRGHTFPVWGVSWHPQEERLASASGDRTVRIWDTVYGELITTLATDDSARAVAWHSDGQRLAALSAQQTLRIWDASSRKDRESAVGELPVWWQTETPGRNAEKLMVLRNQWEEVTTDDWTDLLSLVDLSRDHCAGDWKREDDGTLQSDTEISSRIHVKALPPDNYRLRARFARVSGIEALAITIPVSDAQCRVVLCGWGGEQCGLDMIDGTHVPFGNPTHTTFTCEAGVEHVLEVNVVCKKTTARITASIDGTELFDWEGDTSRLSMAKYERLDHDHCFGLGTYQSEFRFLELSIRTTDFAD